MQLFILGVRLQEPGKVPKADRDQKSATAKRKGKTAMKLYALITIPICYCLLAYLVLG